MAEIVNLRRARKRRERDAADKTAADNRVRFGTPKAARTFAELERQRSERALDGLKRNHRIVAAAADADAPGGGSDEA
ncbi:DUF4169 family protein [Aurantimonas sp. VKM B-3413]|uniref:DUF4169 family protein n=1 Tax=Aurantimonas sp. VKM B-3413 TaxID=2779401 RepID=UPI001E2FF479|nr:DUF4169 family protein [Aurantimonas sp. VKM B-3413]MCB8835884.1 DUF4169 family protein [Aurantimonas sp. VKM B-3413]